MFIVQKEVSNEGERDDERRRNRDDDGPGEVNCECERQVEEKGEECVHGEKVNLRLGRWELEGLHSREVKKDKEGGDEKQVPDPDDGQSRHRFNHCIELRGRGRWARVR